MTLYTYIPYMTTGEVNLNEVKNFSSFPDAENHANSTGYPYYDIIPNQLEITK